MARKAVQREPYFHLVEHLAHPPLRGLVSEFAPRLADKHDRFITTAHWFTECVEHAQKLAGERSSWREDPVCVWTWTTADGARTFRILSRRSVGAVFEHGEGKLPLLRPEWAERLQAQGWSE